jgi:3-oxo-5-alpha-steroid 4-dehydrogenase 3
MATALTVVAWAIRAFYLFSSVAIVTVRLIPAFADRFLAYGARARRQTTGTHGKRGSVDHHQQSVGTQLLDYLATFTVPHSWFTHFYLLSLVCSLTTLSTFYYHEYYHEATVKQTPNLETAAFCAHLMLLQGLRRLLECVYVTRDSASRMWMGHYAIGMAFYIVTNMAIWIEQLCQPPPTNLATTERSVLWTWKTILCTAVFLGASERQNRYHRHLSSLKKYTLPEKHAFQYLIAPHYTMECVIYLSMAVLNVPSIFNQHSQLPTFTTVNWTLFCALVFVAVNLGVTADGTKDWQRKKFPDKSLEIAKRWRIIPWLF